MRMSCSIRIVLKGSVGNHEHAVGAFRRYVGTMADEQIDHFAVVCFLVIAYGELERRAIAETKGVGVGAVRE